MGARSFVAWLLSPPDRLWVADITYVVTWEGYLFLAAVLDALDGIAPVLWPILRLTRRSGFLDAPRRIRRVPRP